jgi:hypothetical protein
LLLQLIGLLVTELLGACAGSGRLEIILITKPGGLVTIGEYCLFGYLFATTAAFVLDYSRRLRDVERKITLLLSHFEIDPTSPVEPSGRVRDLAADPKQRLRLSRPTAARRAPILKMLPK